jgi:hypothetical protein
MLISSPHRPRRALAAVEFAVLAPFLAFLFVLTVDFARVFHYQQVVEQCARNGALYGSRVGFALLAAWGLVLIAIAILARGWGSVFTVGLTIASIVYGPMLGAFLLGVLTRSANERGVMAGIGVSLVAMIGVRVFTPLAWTWYVLAGTAICMTVGLVVSRVGR